MKIKCKHNSYWGRVDFLLFHVNIVDRSVQRKEATGHVFVQFPRVQFIEIVPENEIRFQVQIPVSYRVFQFIFSVEWLGFILGSL